MRLSKENVSDYEPVTRGKHAVPADAAWIGAESPSSGVVKVENVTNDNSVTASEAAASETPKEEHWLIRRGHLPSYLGVFFFTIAVYLRPYEIIGALASLKTMAFWIAIFTLVVYLPAQLGIEGNLTARPREINLLLLLGLAALLSIPFGDDPVNSWETFSDFIKVILMFVVMVNAMRTERRLRWLMFLLLGISWYISAVVLKKYLAGTFEYESFRVGGIGGNMFLNPNDMALHLVTMIPLAIALFLGDRNVIKKVFFGAGALLMMIGVLVSHSRGGVVGLFAAMAVVVWKAGHKKRTVSVALALMIGFTIVVMAPSGLRGRFSDVFKSGDQGGSASLRREELKRSILVAARHPLLGIGIGNYLPRSTRNQASHNSYTQVASEVGIPAMIIYILFMLSVLKRLRKVESEISGQRRESRLYYLAIGLQGSMIGYMVCSFFASVAFLWYVYYLTGLGLCFARIFELRKEARITQKGALPIDHQLHGGFPDRRREAHAPIS